MQYLLVVSKFSPGLSIISIHDGAGDDEGCECTTPIIIGVVIAVVGVIIAITGITIAVVIVMRNQ